MDYKKKVIALLNSHELSNEQKEKLESIFPELKESEDEKIRKALISYFLCIAKNVDTVWTNLDYDKVIDWLEKQSKASKVEESMREVEEKAKAFTETHKGETSEEILAQMQGEQKPADKVAPKFKVGDKIQYLKGCGTIMTIEKIENDEYIFANNLGHTTIENGNKWYLVERNPTWSEEDEKVIHCLEYTVRHFYEDEDTIKWCCDWLKSLKDRVQLQKTWKPSKEQIIALRWVLNNIPYNKHKEEISGLLDHLKDRVQPKQEWNEKDEDILNIIINHFEIDLECTENDDIIRWLKSLRPQNRWKPSDEQMLAINTAINVLGKGTLNGKQLIELREELQKLREE